MSKIAANHAASITYSYTTGNKVDNKVSFNDMSNCKNIFISASNIDESVPKVKTFMYQELDGYANEQFVQYEIEFNHYNNSESILQSIIFDHFDLAHLYINNSAVATYYLESVKNTIKIPEYLDESIYHADPIYIILPVNSSDTLKIKFNRVMKEQDSLRVIFKCKIIDENIVNDTINNNISVLYYYLNQTGEKISAGSDNPEEVLTEYNKDYIVQLSSKVKYSSLTMDSDVTISENNAEIIYRWIIRNTGNESAKDITFRDAFSNDIYIPSANGYVDLKQVTLDGTDFAIYGEPVIDDNHVIHMILKDIPPKKDQIPGTVTLTIRGLLINFI